MSDIVWVACISADLPRSAILMTTIFNLEQFDMSDNKTPPKPVAPPPPPAPPPLQKSVDFSEGANTTTVFQTRPTPPPPDPGKK